MKTISLLASLMMALLFATSAHAVLVDFSYTQTDSLTGSGTIAPFIYNDGGGDISFNATPLPLATVVNPVPGSTPAGFVGAQVAAAGDSDGPNSAVGLEFSGFVLAQGSRGGQDFTMEIPLLFVPKVTQNPDVSDYTWNVSFGDSPANGVETVSSAAVRLAMYLSRDPAAAANTFQRYTQNTVSFVAGQDGFTNTHTTTGTIKDAVDSGDPQGTDAAGRDLAFYFGWRDQGSLSSGAILVDDFAIGGLLNADESTLVAVPEPSSVALAVVGLFSLALVALRRRRAKG